MLKTTINTSATVSVIELPALELAAQVAVINYRAEHRAKVAALASVKATQAGVIANDKTLTNAEMRKSAMDGYLSTDAGAIAASEAVEESLSQIALLEAEAAYYRHLRQAIAIEVDQRKLDTL